MSLHGLLLVIPKLFAWENFNEVLVFASIKAWSTLVILPKSFATQSKLRIKAWHPYLGYKARLGL